MRAYIRICIWGRCSVVHLFSAGEWTTEYLNNFLLFIKSKILRKGIKSECVYTHMYMGRCSVVQVVQRRRETRERRELRNSELDSGRGLSMVWGRGSFMIVYTLGDVSPPSKPHVSTFRVSVYSLQNQKHSNTRHSNTRRRRMIEWEPGNLIRERGGLTHTH